MKICDMETTQPLERAAAILNVAPSNTGIPAAGPLNVGNYNLTDLLVALADRIDQIEKRLSQQDSRSTKMEKCN